MVEFFEMYRIHGATHFIFYNHTVGPDVQLILAHYKKLGLATLLTWNLPLASQKDIRTEAIFTAINDCNMRAAWQYEYLGWYPYTGDLKKRGLNFSAVQGRRNLMHKCAKYRK